MTKPQIRPVTFAVGGIGEVHLLEIDVPHSVLPQKAGRILDILQPHLGNKKLRILEPFISEPEVGMTRQEAAEVAGITGKSDRLFNQAKEALARTAYRGWLRTENMQPDPNIHYWTVPNAVATAEPLSAEDVTAMVDTHLMEHAPFPVVPYDPHHRALVSQAVTRGAEIYQNGGPLVERRIAGLAMAYGNMSQ